jgi:hypothetical protein
MYIKTKHFFQNIYKVYNQIVYPDDAKPFYEFNVKRIYLIQRKDYEIKKVDVTERFQLNPLKLHHVLDLKNHFDGNPEKDYLEMECIVNGLDCRFISTESNNQLTIPLSTSIADASEILYAELIDCYWNKKTDVTEKVRQYCRGTTLFDPIKSVGYADDDDDDGCLKITSPSILEYVFNIPRKNKHHVLKIMKL